ncbi:group III truncated hemoglobin [Marinimicrococcus flavescens]|uniref:Group III truncated hemoglobin n=1 Tax=Marinimicrococcus flavescens TaxID=3031815 RepID=A0AAP3UZW9_9PROT|nr:group III truncated hemoglobin [Marinimicrococcus flavescens]
MERTERCSPGTALGIDEKLIARVVHGFYAEVRRDAVLGPLFERIIGEGWDPHLARMVDFWSSVLLTTGRYQGKPMLVHARIEEIDRPLFERWLALFARTVGRLCAPAQAELFLDRAGRIAQSLLAGVEMQRRLGLAPPYRASPASV